MLQAVCSILDILCCVQGRGTPLSLLCVKVLPCLIQYCATVLLVGYMLLIMQ